MKLKIITADDIEKAEELVNTWLNENNIMPGEIISTNLVVNSQNQSAFYSILYINDNQFLPGRVRRKLPIGD